MLNAVIRFALRYRMLIVFLSLALLIYGGFVMATLPIDVLPDLDRPRVVLLTECPGYAPEDVETLVSFPLEAAINGATGVEAVRSQSGPGISVVYVNFDWGTNIYTARQIVQERLNSADLPEEITPHMAPISSLMGQVMLVGMHYKNAGSESKGAGDRSDVQRQMELRTLADWVVRLRLLKVSGVAQVVAIGGGRKQYQVLVDPRLLQKYKVTLEEVSIALKKNNISASAGWAIQGDKEKPIRFLGRLGPTPQETLNKLKKIPVKGTDKRTITIEQLAKVTEGPQLKRGDASIDGMPGVVLMITKQPNVDTRDLTNRIIDALDELKPSLPPDVVVNYEVFQLKRFIDLGVYNVAEALAIGAVLVLIVLFLFLLNFRTTFISLMAIPLSLAMTACVFQLIGWISGTPLTINVMTLGGIAVAMGELVDDAIVDVENIFRRLRENNALENPRPVTQVVYEASVEIRSAIVFGTAMIILVFLPLFALSGIEGRLFAPLGIAYIVSILASLLVSLTVTPVLSYYLLPKSRATHRTKDSPLLRSLKWGCSYLIGFSMRHAGMLLAVTWILVGISVWMLMQLGTGFLPAFDEGSVQVNVILPSGSSLAASNKASSQVDAVFRDLQKSKDNPDGIIEHFVRRTGRAELDEHVEPVNATEYILTINPDIEEHREEVIKTILDRVNELNVGGSVEVEQPLAHLISHMLTGVTAQLAIKIYGDDLSKLQKTAQEVKAAISNVKGIAPPVIEQQELTDEIHIVPDPESLLVYDVSRDHLYDFVHTAMYGKVVSQVIQQERRFDLLVRLDDPYRNDVQNLGNLLVHVSDKEHGQVQLNMLADIQPALGPNSISREDVRRRIVIRVNTLGRDLGSVVADIRKNVNEKVTMPEGYFVEYGGQFESQQRATLLITILAGISVLAMFVVLYMLYPSWRIVLQILNALPTAFIGGVLALVLTGQTLTVASMIGFISLGGIAVRNGILLVSHYLHLMKHEGEGFTEKMVMRGSLERLSPVLMTAITAGVALLPLVIAGQEPGREILYPVATVIFGGLITSTFCEFLIHPGLFRRFSGSHAERLVQQMQAEE